MSGSELVPCASCGKKLTAKQAKLRDGLCQMCFKMARARRRTEHMEVPADLATEAESQGLSVDLARYFVSDASIPGYEVADVLYMQIESIKEAQKAKEKWLPQLLGIAEKDHQNCKSYVASINDTALQAKLKILDSELASHPLGQANQFAIIEVNEWAIPHVAERWNLNECSSVFLSRAAHTEWQEVYQGPNDFSWYSLHTLYIEDPLSESQWEIGETPDGIQPWVFVKAKHLGPLAGFGSHELWHWNGHDARLVKNIGGWIS